MCDRDGKIQHILSGMKGRKEGRLTYESTVTEFPPEEMPCTFSSLLSFEFQQRKSPLRLGLSDLRLRSVLIDV